MSQAFPSVVGRCSVCGEGGGKLHLDSERRSHSRPSISFLTIAPWFLTPVYNLTIVMLYPDMVVDFFQCGRGTSTQVCGSSILHRALSNQQRTHPISPLKPSGGAAHCVMEKNNTLLPRRQLGEFHCLVCVFLSVCLSPPHGIQLCLGVSKRCYKRY